MICPLVTRVSKEVGFELERKFPGPCKTVAKEGDKVEPESVVAHCEVSAGERLVKIAHDLGASAKDVRKYLLRKIGDRIYRGEIIARKKLLLGLGKKEIRSPADGVITEIDINGDLLVKFLPTPIRLVAGAGGTVAKVGGDSIFIKTAGVKIKGYAGAGRIREGIIKNIGGPQEFITPQKITADCSGKILFGGSLLERAAIEKALTLGVHGIVVGGINHRDFLSLGVGSDIGITVLVTEGFGNTPIGKDIYEALKKLENQFGFVSGEAKNLLIPAELKSLQAAASSTFWRELKVNDVVRGFRQHTEDIIGTVQSLGDKEEILNSGLPAEIATVKFLSGKVVTVASANLEIVET